MCLAMWRVGRRGVLGESKLRRIYSMSRPPVVSCLGDSLPCVSGGGGGAVILGVGGCGSVSGGVGSGHYYSGN